MTERKPASPTPPDQRDVDWEISHLYGLFDEIGMCGCGWPGSAYNLARDLLDHFHDRDERNVVEMIGGEGAAQLALYRLQEADLIDHGTSVISSWMTDKGRYARWLMHRHPPGVIDETGFPDCFDYETGRCPDECWAPPGDVPPEPPRPTFEEISERIRAEAKEARARMNPIERAVYDETQAAMTNMLLYGQHPAPENPQPPRFTGLLSALGDTQGANPWRSAHPLPRVTLPVDEQDRLSSHGRNARIGCRRFDSGTWWHGRPHDCPRWARG